MRRVLHTLVTFIAKPKSDPQKVGTLSNSDLMEDENIQGKGRNELALGWNLVFLFELFFFFFFFFCFFKKITSYFFADKTLDFLEFWVARPFWDEWAHCGEFGFWCCGDFVW